MPVEPHPARHVSGKADLPLVSIVCPVYREAETIEHFHAALDAALTPLRDRYRVEVLYVLDPSPDDSEARLERIAAANPEIGVIVMSRRFGHQAALVAGIEHSDGQAIIMLDSDLQHPPELIPELVRRWEEGAEIVQTLRKDDLSVPWFKRTTSRLFYRFLLRMGSIQLPAGAADYRLVSARVARTLREELTERNPFLRGLFSWVGFNVCYVPFAPVPRFGGKSKYNLATLFGFALNGIFSFSKFPLRLCIGAGIALALLSVAFTVVQIGMYAFGSDAVPGWASLFGAVGIIGGIQLLFLGMIGEYISIIFDEVKRRPRYLIKRQRDPANRHPAAVASAALSEASFGRQP
jgi:polyisoprenyl-phosphate glycosyltransferase